MIQLCSKLERAAPRTTGSARGGFISDNVLINVCPVNNIYYTDSLLLPLGGV